MRALVWHGKEDIRCDSVSDPEIENERDAIIKVTSCAICGSDLHLFHNFIPAMLPGAEAAGLESHPAVGVILAILFEAEVAVVVLAKAGERREVFLDPCEEVKDRVA